MNIYNYKYRFRNKVSHIFAYLKSLFFYFVSFSFFLKKKYDPKSIKQIIVINNFGNYPGIGDSIISINFVDSIKKKFPDANLNLLMNPQYQFLFKHKIYKNISELKKTDLIIDLSPTRENFNLYKNLSKNILLRNPIVGSDQLFFGANKYMPPIINKNIIDYNNQILKELNIKCELNEQIYPSKDYIIINLFGAKKIRYIPEDLALNLILKLSTVERIYLTYYSVQEEKYIKSILNKISIKNIKPIKLELIPLIEIIKYSKYIITSDTGIAHIAGYYNKPVLVIFGPGNINTWQPAGKNTKILFNKTCHGCERHKDDWMCTRECLEKININDIIKKINMLNID